MGGRKQFRVTGTLNGVPMKSFTFPYWGEGLWMGVHKATREKAGSSSVTSSRSRSAATTAPRVLELAPELEAALGRGARAP